MGKSNGNLVAVRDEDKDGFWFAKFSQKGGVVTLSYDNPKFKPLSFGLFDPNNRIRILGKVDSLVLRKFD